MMEQEQTMCAQENAPVPNRPKSKKEAFCGFLKRKDIVFSGKRYGIDALGAMALGLFGSLLIGTIFTALGMIPHCEFFIAIGKFAQAMAGPAMAAAIAATVCTEPVTILGAQCVEKSYPGFWEEYQLLGGNYA